MSLLSSLTNRIFFASAMLVLASISVIVYRVNVSITSQAQAELVNGLNEAASLVDEYKRAQFDHFVGLGRLVADLPRLKAAVAEDHPPTVQPIAEEYEQQIKADLFIVIGKNRRVLARTGRIALAALAIEDMPPIAGSGSEATAFWPYAGGVLQLAALPISIEPGPELLGTLIVGFSLDGATAGRFKALTNSDIVFRVGSRTVASTLSPDRTAALSGLDGTTGVFQRVLGSEEFVGRVQPLGSSAGGPDEPVALVLRSRTERLSFLQRFYTEVVVTGILAVLVSTLVGYAIARTVTRPLRAVTQTMREMAATGDLARTAPMLGRWDDEDARLLATTFRQMTTALDRFQREAAQRERLSSLGRLSTVVAHEVRNPLMILKSAVRNLRKHPSVEVAAAATSIDEEVNRLNRVVTDVLDFARPIRYDIAPTDLIELCRNAAEATQAGPDSAEISIEPSTSTAPIVTDGERLRAVLINVLTNAGHAVLARGEHRAEPPIRVQIAKVSPSGWMIAVSDRGRGISAEDLPRVFEPFFTTRRAGSGLGLALARTVIEGLGGTIAIESQVNAGTTVRISLPDQAPVRQVPA
jgi:signal transduction histidine kinase